MVEYQAHVGRVFAALADPTRRAIVEQLARTSRRRVTDIAESFPMSLNAVSKHLRVLENSGVLVRQREGRVHYCSLDPNAFSAPTEWMNEQRRFWEQRLDAMEAMFIRRKRSRRAIDRQSEGETEK